MKDTEKESFCFLRLSSCQSGSCIKSFTNLALKSNSSEYLLYNPVIDKEMHEEKLRTSQKDEKESLERNLTEEEVAVYDRQIRLWGVESQKR